MIRKMNIWKVSTIVLALALLGSIYVHSRQGNMWAAVKNLNQAKKRLQAAKRNKGGHRVKAIHHINKALDHVHAGIKFARGRR